MTLEANQHNIAWLTEKLYEVSREIAANGCANPTFILLTKGQEDRHRVEKIFWNFYIAKYGMDCFKQLMPETQTCTACYFSLPGVPCRIVLMDI